MRRSVSIKSSVQVSNQKKLHNCLNYIDENDSNVLMPLVNSSINFMMVSSCLTTFLFLALTLHLSGYRVGRMVVSICLLSHNSDCPPF